MSNETSGAIVSAIGVLTSMEEYFSLSLEVDEVQQDQNLGLWLWSGEEKTI